MVFTGTSQNAPTLDRNLEYSFTYPVSYIPVSTVSMVGSILWTLTSVSHHASSMLNMIDPNPSRGQVLQNLGWVDARSLPRDAEMCVWVALTHRSPPIPSWGISHLPLSPCRVSALRQQNIHNLSHIIIQEQGFWRKWHGWPCQGQLGLILVHLRRSLVCISTAEHSQQDTPSSSPPLPTPWGPV